MDKIIGTLQTIQQLWIELRETKPRTAKYETLVKSIRVLSAEYQALADAKSNSNLRE